jgi:hypothetical protein
MTADLVFVSDDASYARDLLNNPQVNVSFVDTGDSLYVSVCGHAQLLKDRAKAEELWSPLVKAWFPGGLDDPKLSLIKVTIQSAEYWDSSASKMMQFYEMARPPSRASRRRTWGNTAGSTCSRIALFYPGVIDFHFNPDKIACIIHGGPYASAIPAAPRYTAFAGQRKVAAGPCTTWRSR